ncbi:hypothetical protein Q1695_000958 [Nippostrongylus brasiliensis]|nr:hypothetical protein Q1695_000958 [Nippostrongylus brasiliensis]
MASKDNESLGACRELHYLNDDKGGIVRALRRKLMPVYNDDGEAGPQPSRANVGVSQISIPLAWNSDQHFKSKGETRVYSMFVVLQSKTRVVDSRMVTNIDRTMTDVVFPEAFIFEREPDDFCVEITIYAARTDLGLSDGGGSLRTRITRSLGRRFGGQVKSNLSAVESSSGARGDTAIGGTHFNMLARAYLVLTDAGDECKIHDLKMSAFADLSGPPLYGHILCRLAVQPHSVLRPLAEGMLSIKPLCGGRILRNVRTRLQAGNLHCFMNTDIHQNPSAEQTLLLVPITATSRITTTTQTNTLMLSSDNSSEVEGYDFYITTESQRTMLSWRKAIEMQIDDCAIWGEFAYRPTKLTFEKPTDPVKETLSRAAGNRLYDKISIGEGSISRNSMIFSPSLSYYPQEFSPLKSSAQTAPTKRFKPRVNVLDIFEKPSSPGAKVTQRSRSSSPVHELHKCVIELGDNGGYGRVRSEMSPSYMPRTVNSSGLPTRSSYLPLSVAQSPEPSDVSVGRSGKKSWPRSMGALLTKKIQTHPVEVTRL